MADAEKTNRLTQLLKNLRASTHFPEQTSLKDLVAAANELSIEEGISAIDGVFARDETFRMVPSGQEAHARRFLREMLFTDHPDREKQPTIWEQHVGKALNPSKA